MSRTLGLIAAGGVSQSFLARHPAIRERLGPVYSPQLRIASRIVNALRVGNPVTAFAAFSRCPIVLMAIPDDALDATVAAAAAADLNWQGRIVVLCESLHDSQSLERLRTLGARVASLDPIPATGESKFVAEGDVAAITELNRLLGRPNLLVLAPGGKPRYQAGLLLATDLTLALTAGAVDSLRAAGLTRPQAAPIIETLVAQTGRSYRKAGLRAAAGLPPPAELARWVASLRAHDDRLANMIENALKIAPAGQ